MPTIIELHLLSFFITDFFMLLSCKILLKKGTRTWKIILCAIFLAALKLVMDIFVTNIFAQIAVIILCAESLMIFLFKVNHISRLFAYLAIFLAFNLGIYAMQALLAVLFSSKVINYVSNYYLLCQIGFACITFALAMILAEYRRLFALENFVKDCQIAIGGKKINLAGYIDTGNKLVESKSNLAIFIVNFDAIKKHISRQIYADLVLCTNSSGAVADIGKYMCSTLAGTNYLTIFRPQKFWVAGKNVDCYVGISFANQVQNYDALLSCECI